MNRWLKAVVLLAAIAAALFAVIQAPALAVSRLPLPVVSTVPIAQETPPAAPQDPGWYLPFIFNGMPTASQPIVSASVLLEDGFCCAGGIAGETIEITAAYQAHSPVGEVVEMRTRSHGGAGCLEEADLAGTAWKPFSETEIFTHTLAINWQGFYVSAQFRDEAGNLSAVVCDDISLEGMPAPTP